MTAQAFYTKRPLWLLLPAALGVWLAFGSRLWALLQGETGASVWSAAGMGLLSLVAIALLRSRRRPVVEIVDGELRYAPGSTLRRAAFALDDVVAVRECDRLLGRLRHRIRITLRDGSLRTLPLAELREVDRARVLAVLRDAAGG